MRQLWILVILTFFLLSFSTKIEQGNQYFVQVRIIGISTSEEAKTIDKKIEKKSNIASANTDYITGTFFCLLEPGIDISESEVRGWFTKLGYEIQCFYKGVQGVDGVRSPHELKNCEDKGEGN